MNNYDRDICRSEDVLQLGGVPQNQPHGAQGPGDAEEAEQNRIGQQRNPEGTSPSGSHANAFENGRASAQVVLTFEVRISRKSSEYSAVSIVFLPWGPLSCRREWCQYITFMHRESIVNKKWSQHCKQQWIAAYSVPWWMLPTSSYTLDICGRLSLCPWRNCWLHLTRLRTEMSW